MTPGAWQFPGTHVLGLSYAGASLNGSKDVIDNSNGSDYIKTVSLSRAKGWFLIAGLQKRDAAISAPARRLVAIIQHLSLGCALCMRQRAHKR